VWQALRSDLHPKGLEIVTVGLDVLGAEGCRAFIEAAAPEHPSLVDQHHVLAELFGVVNIPSSIWIDEQGVIVRPAETAPAPPVERDGPAMDLPAELPPRFVDIMGEAAKIQSNAEAYHAALRDWVEKGADSEFALDPDTVIARSRPRDADVALGHAHFELATQLEMDGHHDAAIEHFREAHRLVPTSWTFRRQAWSLEQPIEGPLARFWQGPSDDDPESWPYEGDWLSDIRREGAENYNDPWQP
jgi:hypothetical protein